MFTRSCTRRCTRIWTLTRIGMALSLGPITFMAAPTPARAVQPAEPPDLDSTYQGEAPERYAQVRAVEGDVRIRKGEIDEALERGVPVAEGDIIDSRGRGVLQLGDGTRVAFASGTRFQVAALFTDKKGERQVLLRLDHGRLRIGLGGHSEARFRVDTPSGTAAMLDRGNATLQVQSDQSVRVRVHSGHLTFTNDQDKVRISAGERLTIYSRADRLDRVSSFNTYDRDAFDSYCERAFELRRGASWDRVPAEIRYYSDELDENGEWVEVPDAGWCWRPRAVVADWRPYWRGRWGAYAGGMTWVSDDPWGYVTFHFGRWGWHSNWGWYWMPGVYYSPAWVAWHWNAGYYGWAPLNHWNRPCHWGYGAWGGGYCWNVVLAHHINAHRIHGHVHHERTVIAGFHGGTGSSSWSGGWRTAPLLVTQAEFRSPAQMSRAFDRRVAAERMQAYERTAATTGRAIVRRDPVPTTPDARVPFEDRNRSRLPGSPILRENTGIVPPDRRTPSGVTPPARREQPREDRDFFGEERKPREQSPREQPRERSQDETPRPTERRRELPQEERRREGPAERRSPEPAPRESIPRERTREERPAPREERRVEPSRDRPRESYRDERHAAPPPSRPPSPPPAPPPAAPSRPAPSAPPRGGDGPRR